MVSLEYACGGGALVATFMLISCGMKVQNKWWNTIDAKSLFWILAAFTENRWNTQISWIIGFFVFSRFHLLALHSFREFIQILWVLGDFNRFPSHFHPFSSHVSCLLEFLFQRPHWGCEAETVRGGGCEAGVGPEEMMRVMEFTWIYHHMDFTWLYHEFTTPLKQNLALTSKNWD